MEIVFSSLLIIRKNISICHDIKMAVKFKKYILEKIFTFDYN